MSDLDLEPTMLERLGMTTDILGTYRRGVLVGRSKAVEEVIDWMVGSDYPVGECDDLTTLLTELRRMAFEAGRADAEAEIGAKFQLTPL